MALHKTCVDFRHSKLDLVFVKKFCLKKARIIPKRRFKPKKWITYPKKQEFSKKNEIYYLIIKKSLIH